jgi:tRNA modification GTPase
MLDIDDNIPQNIDARTILVRAKADLAAHDDVAVSGLTGLGVDRLITIIGEKLSDQVGSVGVAIRDRHRIALERGKAELEEALLKLQNDDGLAEITAEHIWRAIRSVDSLVGRVDVEDILDEIFSSFCIGK